MDRCLACNGKYVGVVGNDLFLGPTVGIGIGTNLNAIFVNLDAEKEAVYDII